MVSNFYPRLFSSSILEIFPTRLACFPPAKLACSQVSTISSAVPIPITLLPRASIFALLCSMLILAMKVSVQRAALMPGILLAAIDIPIPVPQTKIPFSHSPFLIAWATETA